MRLVGGSVGVVVVARDGAVGVDGAGLEDHSPLVFRDGDVEPRAPGWVPGGELVPRLILDGDVEAEVAHGQLLDGEGGRALLELNEGLIDLPREVIAVCRDVEVLTEGAEHLEEVNVAAAGIEVRTGARAERVESRDGSIVVTLTGGAEVTGERLLVATGHAADLSDLGLESAGIDASGPFIEVDERMRATDGIWAMGDVTGKGLLTTVAAYQSAIVAAEILGRDHPQRGMELCPG